MLIAQSLARHVNVLRDISIGDGGSAPDRIDDLVFGDGAPIGLHQIGQQFQGARRDGGWAAVAEEREALRIQKEWAKRISYRRFDRCFGHETMLAHAV